MKKQFLAIGTLLLIASLQSCGGPDFGSSTPICDWTIKGNVRFSNLSLQHPDGMSNWYNAKFNYQPINVLDDVLHTVGDANYAKSAAKISIKLTSDNNTCIGEKTFSFERFNSQSAFPPEVKGTSVDILTPSSGGFSGDIVANINTSEFNNTNIKTGETFGQWYRVLWTTSTNKTFGVSFVLNGNLIGKKITLVQRAGAKSDKSSPSLLLEDGGIIIGGIKKQI